MGESRALNCAVLYSFLHCALMPKCFCTTSFAGELAVEVEPARNWIECLGPQFSVSRNCKRIRRNKNARNWFQVLFCNYCRRFMTETMRIFASFFIFNNSFMRKHAQTRVWECFFCVLYESKIGYAIHDVCYFDHSSIVFAEFLKIKCCQELVIYCAIGSRKHLGVPSKSVIASVRSQRM